MSCSHGNHPDACGHCDEENRQWTLGYESQLKELCEVKAQRDELVAKYVAQPVQPATHSDNSVTAYKLAEKELERLVKEKFGRMPKSKWSDQVLDLRDAYEAVNVKAEYTGHDSDCSVHNEPAFPAGPCDCCLAHPVPPAQAEPLSDGEIAKIVNDLRDVAQQFHGTQQLRERIAHVIVPALKAKGDT